MVKNKKTKNWVNWVRLKPLCVGAELHGERRPDADVRPAQLTRQVYRNRFYSENILWERQLERQAEVGPLCFGSIASPHVFPSWTISSPDVTSAHLDERNLLPCITAMLPMAVSSQGNSVRGSGLTFCTDTRPAAHHCKTSQCLVAT